MSVLVIKVTENCNSDCIYCYSHEENSSIMNSEILKKIVVRINEFLTEYPEERIDLIWHGGEPLLAGVEFYRTAHEYFKKYCKDTGERISHSIQTNLTLFNKSFAEVFTDMGILSIGTSYDQAPGMRGLCKGIGYLDYNKNFFKGLGLLYRYSLNWGLIYVATKQSIINPPAVFHFLTNLQINSNLTINPVTVSLKKELTSSQNYEITPEEYMDFLGAIFPEWWNNRGRYKNVQPFTSLHSCIIKNEKENCMHFGICEADSNKIIINPDGTYLDADDSDPLNNIYGSVTDKNLDSVYREINGKYSDKKNQQYSSGICAGCRFISLCGMDCPESSGFVKNDKWCRARIGFIEKYFEPLTGIKYSGNVS